MHEHVALTRSPDGEWVVLIDHTRFTLQGAIQYATALHRSFEQVTHAVHDALALDDLETFDLEATVSRKET